MDAVKMYNQLSERVNQLKETEGLYQADYKRIAEWLEKLGEDRAESRVNMIEGITRAIKLPDNDPIKSVVLTQSKLNVGKKVGVGGGGRTVSRSPECQAAVDRIVEAMKPFEKDFYIISDEALKSGKYSHTFHLVIGNKDIEFPTKFWYNKEEAGKIKKQLKTEEKTDSEE